MLLSRFRPMVDGAGQPPPPRKATRGSRITGGGGILVIVGLVVAFWGPLTAHTRASSLYLAAYERYVHPAHLPQGGAVATPAQKTDLRRHAADLERFWRATRRAAVPTGDAQDVYAVRADALTCRRVDVRLLADVVGGAPAPDGGVAAAARADKAFLAANLVVLNDFGTRYAPPTGGFVGP